MNLICEKFNFHLLYIWFNIKIDISFTNIKLYSIQSAKINSKLTNKINLTCPAQKFNDMLKFWYLKTTTRRLQRNKRTRKFLNIRIRTIFIEKPDIQNSQTSQRANDSKNFRFSNFELRTFCAYNGGALKSGNFKKPTYRQNISRYYGYCSLYLLYSIPLDFPGVFRWFSSSVGQRDRIF